MKIPLATFTANSEERKKMKTYLQCRIEALQEAKEIALATNDGKIAAEAIQQKITTLQLQQEVKQKKSK